MLSLFLIMKRVDKVFHVGKFFEVSKEFQQKDADRIVGKASQRIFMSDNGPYKRKVNEGRDKPRKTAGNPAVRMDFDISRVIGVPG